MFYSMFLISDGFKKGKKAQKSDEKSKNRRKLKIFALLCTTNLIIYYIGAEKREQQAILSADCSRFYIIICVAGTLRGFYAFSSVFSGSEKSSLPVSTRMLYHWMNFLMSQARTRSASYSGMT